MTLHNATAQPGLTWEKDGIVLIEDAFRGDALARLQQWVTELEQMPGTATELLQYDEKTPSGDSRRCRTENFVPYHEGLRNLITTGQIPQLVGELLGEEARLYKEKINYKAPGGAGFAPHQDAPAYPFVQQTVACMVAVDEATLENGCLEIVRGSHQKQLTTDENGCIATVVAEKLKWEPLPVRAGSLLFFHCYVPHRSGSNTSEHKRRAIYLTYNGASDGDLRADYYAAKIPELAANPERFSLIGHFTGSVTPVTSEGSSDERGHRQDP
jgi:ectoine hydroxylase-related dioxygenase (phytanoyl-CoA dioxygenase family)